MCCGTLDTPTLSSTLINKPLGIVAPLLHPHPQQRPNKSAPSDGDTSVAPPPSVASLSAPWDSGTLGTEQMTTLSDPCAEASHRGTPRLGLLYQSALSSYDELHSYIKHMS